MIHSTKEYWFAFEPYIHIALKQDEALLYNTLDRECIRVTDGELLDLLTAIVDKQNCGVIKITKEDLERPVTFNFLKTVRDKFFGDLYDCELSDRKPIQLYPVLNLQEEVTRLQRFDSGFVGTNMFTYLYQVKVDFDHLDEHESCRLADKVWSEVVCSEVKRLLFVVYTTEQQQALQAWSFEKERVQDVMEWMGCLGTDNSALSLAVDSGYMTTIRVTEPEKWKETIGELTKRQEGHVYWIFNVSSEKELEQANEIVEKYAIQEYKIEPEYRGDNLPFFEENVFLYEEDILSKHLSMQDLMRNQILNSNDFGKLSVCSNGDMYTNELSPTVGNIWTNDVRKLIYKEMTEGHSWLRIRDQKPCYDCIYQWLCPSPSNYELAIGKPNLCHVKP